MSVIADGLRLTHDKLESTGQPDVAKVVYGSLKDISVKAETHREYSETKSKEAGKEVYQDVDLIKFKLDKWSEVPVTLSELSHQQRRELAPLIDSLQNKVENTNETKVLEWAAISAMEKQYVILNGVHTVEQLRHVSEQEAYKYGPSGKEILAKAKRHTETKEEERKAKEEGLESVKTLRAELEALKAQLVAQPEKIDLIEQEASKAKKKVKEEVSK